MLTCGTSDVTIRVRAVESVETDEPHGEMGGHCAFDHPHTIA